MILRSGKFCQIVSIDLAAGRRFSKKWVTSLVHDRSSLKRLKEGVFIEVLRTPLIREKVCKVRD